MKYSSSTLRRRQTASVFITSVSSNFLHLRGIVHACLIFSNPSRLLKKVRMKIYSNSTTRERLRIDISKVLREKLLKKLFRSMSIIISFYF